MPSLISTFTAALVLLLSPVALAQEDTTARREATEYAVKAAFLYNFVKFVTWPESAFEGPRATFRIGILGVDPFQGALRQIVREKQVGGRDVEIVHFGKAETVDGCHILFVHVDDPAVVGELKGKARRQHILTVGEADGFLEAGGMILMSVREGYIKLEISEQEAWEAELRIAAGLLDLAERVIPRPRERRKTP